MSKTLEAIFINRVPASFVQNVFDKGTFDGAPNKKYSTTLVLDPKKKAHKKIIKQCEAHISELIDGELKGNAPEEKKLMCFRHGKSQTLKAAKRPEYKGKYTLRIANENYPMVLDQQKNELSKEDGAALFYSGCLVNAKVSFWANHGSVGPVVGCNMIGIQFAGDSEPFDDSHISAEEAMEGFEEIENDDPF